MVSFVARRCLLTIPVLLGVATLVFSLIHLVPGDPVQVMLGESASPTEVSMLRERLGLDQPLGRQYLTFMAAASVGDLGRSLRTNRPVAEEIAVRFPATLELAAASMALAIVFAIPLGILSAVKAGTWLDHATSTVALLGISVPGFWLGPLLAIAFSISLGWLPVSGRGTLAHLVLPAVTLGAPLGAVLARTTRASLLEELHAMYVLAARARGFSEVRTVLRHALRNSLIPVVTVLGLQFGVVLTGAVVTETIFAWPGVGRFLIQAIASRDYPAVQGCILFIAVVYVSMNLLVDLSYGWLDHRIRYE
jgi:ABC-type dipeptide/oligopeptide/nickel transport system permease component